MAEKQYWDERVSSALEAALQSGDLRIIHEVDELFEELTAAFPFGGTKIDWRDVPGSLHAHGDQEDYERFFLENTTKMGWDAPAYYLSDNSINFAIAGSVERLAKHLPIILENPEHHYFTAEDFSWCMALTMEGDMDFGFRPELPA